MGNNDGGLFGALSNAAKNLGSGFVESFEKEMSLRRIEEECQRETQVRFAVPPPPTHFGVRLIRFNCFASDRL